MNRPNKTKSAVFKLFRFSLFSKDLFTCPDQENSVTGGGGIMTPLFHQHISQRALPVFLMKFIAPCDFPGGGLEPLPPPLDPPMVYPEYLNGNNQQQSHFCQFNLKHFIKLYTTSAHLENNDVSFAFVVQDGDVLCLSQTPSPGSLISIFL